MTVFPSNNLYHHVVERSDIPTVSICSRTINNSEPPTPTPLVRTLSFPILRTTDELVDIIRLLYFVQCVDKHESGNLIVWTLVTQPEHYDPYNHIGLLRGEGTPATPIVQHMADDIMHTGIYQSCFNISGIERVLRTGNFSEMNVTNQYDVYIVYIREENLSDHSTTLEEGEVARGAW